MRAAPGIRQDRLLDCFLRLLPQEHIRTRVRPPQASADATRNTMPHPPPASANRRTTRRRWPQARQVYRRLSAFAGPLTTCASLLPPHRRFCRASSFHATLRPIGRPCYQMFGKSFHAQAPLLRRNGPHPIKRRRQEEQAFTVLCLTTMRPTHMIEKQSLSCERARAQHAREWW